MILPGKIEAFVLAGGKSSRMGRDKGLISLCGKPMVSYALEALQKTGLPVKIIANKQEYQDFGHPVFEDVVPEKGPLGGLFTAFENTEADYVLLLGCDMPFVKPQAIELLIQAVKERKITASLKQHKINPLFSVYPVDLLDAVKEAISVGELRMTDFILRNPHILVPSIAQTMPWCFRNINNEQELKEAEERWSHLL